MSSISIAQSLRSFVPGVQRRCFMIVYPNPLFWMGLRTGSSNQTTYLLSFGRGHDDMMVAGKNAWAVSYSNKYSTFQAHQDRLEFSKWINILDSGKASGSKKNLRETLIEVLELFPRHTLDSKNGVETAARELDGRIRAVAAGFEEAKKVVGTKVALA
ncbi:hypothetical protein Moror_17016 [Moniliophthora roreri MCA 2997]|uniref:Uncharacterized protein n=1 Tax=Moniliophthora roreri (strain MCA 2997) TaxID=1381753 RepID=V2WRG9_MONRO|nr:hypothetical protein Moror_17016 [Moniliophthora roreri MCA 2997]